MTLVLHFTAKYNETYKEAFNDAILMIKNRPLGAEMIRQIEESTNVVTVRKNPNNSCLPEQGDPSCYLEVLNDDVFFDALARIATNKVNDRFQWARAFKKAKIEWREKNQTDSLLIYRRKTTRTERGKAAYHLMHLLTAGPGSSAEVKWDGEREEAGQPDALWNKRPAWVLWRTN